MKKKRVYVLDDVELLRTMLKHILEREGFRVKMFASPVDLMIELVEATDIPYVIIADYGMPEMKGDQFVKEVRRMGTPFDQIPVLGLSDSHPEAREAFAKVGCTFLQKTLFNASDLIKEVKRLSNL
jgi:two-component system response regulator TtrR